MFLQLAQFLRFYRRLPSRRPRLPQQPRVPQPRYARDAAPAAPQTPASAQAFCSNILAAPPAPRFGLRRIRLPAASANGWPRRMLPQFFGRMQSHCAASSCRRQAAWRDAVFIAGRRLLCALHRSCCTRHISASRQICFQPPSRRRFTRLPRKAAIAALCALRSQFHFVFRRRVSSEYFVIISMTLH